VDPVTPPPPPPTSPSAAPAWSRLHLWQIQPLRDIMIFVAMFGLLWLGYRLSIVTVPILLALLLAYLFEPVVRWVTRRNRVRRPFAALSIIVLSTLVVVAPAGFGIAFGLAQGSAFVQTQSANIQQLLKVLDKPEDQSLRDALPSERWRSLADWLIKQEARAALDSAVEGAKRGIKGAEADGATVARPTGPAKDATANDPDTLTGSTPEPPATGDTDTDGNLPMDLVASGVAQITSQAVEWLRNHAGDLGARAVRVGAGALGTLGRVAGSFATLLFGGFLTLFFFYFFCVSWDRVLCAFKELVPISAQPRVFELASRMDRVIAGFVRGRLTICLCQIVLFTIAYLIIGVPAAFIVGPLVGLLTLVPYGASVGMPVAMLLMALSPNIHNDFRDSWWFIIGAPIFVQGISQVLDDYILTPKIQGKNTDMSVPMILFASIAGGVLGGVYGLLLAIPVAACAKILYFEIVLPRLKAWAAGTAADPLPFSR
jgi:predicted PurR-regulated permease PerM